MNYKLAFLLLPAVISGTLVIWWITLSAMEMNISKIKKRLYIILSICAAVFSMILIYVIISELHRIPEVASNFPEQKEELSLTKPELYVTFKTPVNLKNLKIFSFPEYEFSVEDVGFMKKIIPYATTIKITPKTTIKSDEQLLIYLTHIKGVFSSGYGGEYLLEVNTPKIQIISVSPIELASPIASTQPIEVTLNIPFGNETDWDVSTIPEHPIFVEKKDDYTLLLTPDIPYKQASEYILQLTNISRIKRVSDGEILTSGEPEQLLTYHFSTSHPAFVDSFSPQGPSTNPASDIEIQFDQSMDKESVLTSLKVEPLFQYTPLWDASGSSLLLQHDPLQKNTSYTVTLEVGMMTQSGSTLDTPATFTFQTPGPLKIVKSLPTQKESNVSVLTPVTIEFDQDIAPSVVEDILISPFVAGKVESTGRTLTFTPDEPLLYNTTYTLTIPIATLSLYGLPSEREQSISFTTSSEETILPVPYFRQQSQFTCNIAAARMLLAYKGITVSEQDLISAAGNGGKRGSGNPFSGYIDNYGTYWDALSKGISKYAKNTILTTDSLADIIHHIQKGNPVMIWGQNGWSNPHDISWTASDGTFIKAVNGMHSSVVRGYKGPPESPTELFINDPWRGYYSISTEEFMRRWKFFSVALVLE
jgi:uncharacterized protein YvpB